MSLLARGCKPSLSSSDIGHVALVSLTYPSYSPNSLEQLVTILSYLHEVGGPDEFKSFLHRAIASRTFVPESFIVNMANIIFDEEALDGTLASLLKVLEFFYAGHPAVLHARAQVIKFSEVLLSAALRQVCRGKERCVWPILETVFWHLECVLCVPDGVSMLCVVLSVLSAISCGATRRPGFADSIEKLTTPSFFL